MQAREPAVQCLVAGGTDLGVWRRLLAMNFRVPYPSCFSRGGQLSFLDLVVLLT